MKMSSKLLALLLSVVVVGCSENSIDESCQDPITSAANGRHIVVDLYSPSSNGKSGSRMSVTPTDECWSVDWEYGDKVAGWFSETATLEEYSMESLDATSGLASFGGTAYDGEQMRFIYPYDSQLVNDNGSITLSVANQSVDLTEDTSYNSFGERGLYMLCESFAVDEAASVSTTMRHIFTILELTFNVSDIADESLIVTNVSISGLGDQDVSIPFGYLYTDALTTVDGNDDTISLDITGASALSNGDGVLTIPIVVVPFVLSESQQIDWSVTFSDGSSVDGVKIISAENAGQQYNRGEYNTFLVNFSANDVGYPSIDQPSYLLSEISMSAVPVGDEWEITDANEDSTLTEADFEGLIDAITAANRDGREPKITFSNLKNLPNNAMELTALAEADRYKAFSVYLPEVTEIPERAFQQCRGLTYISAPKATTIDVYGLGNCFSLEGFDLSGITTAPSNAFCAVPMTSIELPSLTRLNGGSVFNLCYTLTSLELGTGDDCDGVNFINSNAFYFISSSYKASVDAVGKENADATLQYDLTNVDLTIKIDPSTTTISVDSESNTLTTNNNATYTFKSITVEKAPATDFNGALSDFDGTYKAATMGATWTITDSETAAFVAGSGYHDDFDNLVSAIQAANSAGVNPKLIFTNLVAVPENAFFNGVDKDNGLGFSIELQSATSVGNFAIRRCNKLTSIKAEKLKYAGARVISNCGCTTITLPELCGSSATNSKLGGQTFRGSNALTTVKLPKVTSLGANEFNACGLLTYIELGTDDECGGVTTLSLNNATVSNASFANMPKIGEMTLKIKVGENPNFSIVGNVLTVPNEDKGDEIYTFGTIEVVE